MKARVLLSIAVGLLVVFLGWQWWRTPERVVRGRALDRRELALRVLGEYLASQAAGQSVLIVANPFSRQPGQPREVAAFESVAIAGLKSGWRDSLQLAGVAYPELTEAARRDPSSVPMPPDASTPLSFLTTGRAWDQLAEQHPEAGVLVSLIGLPAGLEGMNWWKQPKPRVALLLPDLRLAGDASSVLAAFRSGKILAAVLNRPGAPPERTAMAKDYRAEFEARYLLLTPANAEDVLRLMPGLF